MTSFLIVISVKKCTCCADVRLFAAPHRHLASHCTGPDLLVETSMINGHWTVLALQSQKYLSYLCNIFLSRLFVQQTAFATPVPPMTAPMINFH